MALCIKGKKPLSTPEDILEHMDEKLFDRISKSYKPEDRDFMEQVQQAWLVFHYNDYDGDSFDPLYKLLKGRIRMFAAEWERKWKIEKRLSRNDFESIFWETAWKVCINYNHLLNRDFLLYEHIKHAIKCRGQDLVRRESTLQHTFEHAADSYEKKCVDENTPDGKNIERMITDKQLYKQIISDTTLTDDEKDVIKAIHANPGASYRALAGLLGYSHHEYISRIIGRINKKLERYKNDYNNCVYPPYGRTKRRG